MKTAIKRSARIKDKLHAYVDQGDEKLLKMLLALAKEYMAEEENYELTKEELKVLETRTKNRLNGKSKTYDWPEVKSKILSRKRIGK